LEAYNLKLSLTKCDFGKSQIEFLRYLVDKDGISPNKNKTNAISKMPFPENYHDLRRWLGMINYYRRWLPKAAEYLKPLTDLLRNSEPMKNNKKRFNYDKLHVDAFYKCLDEVNNTVKLAHPPADIAEIEIISDASSKVIGCVLNIKNRPIAFFSRRLSPTEANYSTFDRELLAAFAFVKYFLPFVESHKTILKTDHKPLIGGIT
jgi:hypothetical protein